MRSIAVALLVALVCVGAAGCGARTGALRADERGSLVASLPPQPGPGQWAEEITNPRLPFKPGTKFTYRGKKNGIPLTDTLEVSKETRMVNGVRATVVVDTERLGDHIIEVTEDWYAQDSQGNVWYMGEASRTLDRNGKVTGTKGSWEAGVDGAQAGLFMPAAPKVGDEFYQEYYRGVAEDRYRIASMTETRTVPFGTYANVLVTEERTALEPGVSKKCYAEGVGLIWDGDAGEYLELVSITKE